MVLHRNRGEYQQQHHHPKAYMEHKKTQIAKAILRKKASAEGITFLYFKTYYRVITTRAV